MRPTNPVDDYAARIVAGELPAGKYHRLACKRHLEDRRRELKPDFPFRFDVERALRIVRFAEKLKHYKGEWAGQFITLQPYQVFRLGSIFGWVHKAGPLVGLRRFRTAYNEIPRKNGKSLEAAIVALYVSFFDGEPGAEGYCIATKREQAKIVFNDAKKLVASSGLRTRIKSFVSNLNRPDKDAKLQPLGADNDSTDGLNPNLIIVDEFHAHKDRGLIDVMETATGARRQPLNFQITTAGNDPVSPCGDQHDYACKILDGVIEDDTFFAFIAHADEKDDWLDPRTAQKANPNYGVSIKPEDLASLALKAKNMPSAAAAYKQKRLNLWVNTLQPWLSLEGWRKGQTTWKLEQMRGQRCWAGVDLSSKIDLMVRVLCFPPNDDRLTWRYHLVAFTPADTLAERAHRDRAPYQRWVDEGYLTPIPGTRQDQDFLFEQLEADAEMFDLREIGIDPWNAANLVKDLTEEDYEAIEIPQTMKHMSQPSKEFEADVLAGLVDTGGNSLFQWAASNAVVERDGKDNIYPVKKKSRGRIDPVIAAIMSRLLADAPAPDESAYGDHPLMVV